MKLFHLQPRSERGSALLMTMVFTGLIGFSLASYLTLVSAQNRSVVRSQTWNATIPVIEAGIEEALAHLNQNGITNLFSQGWRNQYGYAMRKRWLGKSRYTVAITPTIRPIVECSGYVPAPILFAQSGGPLFAQVGTMGFNNNTYIYRTVRVQTKGGPLFSRGMVAKGSINMNGNNVASDSFDSADPNFSTNGQYDPNKKNDNGDVATNAGGNVFDAGNANVMGSVATGPGGTITVGPASSIGTKAWVQGGNAGIEPGRSSSDMNMEFPDVKVPFSGGMSPALNVLISETNTYYGTGLVTTASLPVPLPAGPIVTNLGTFTTMTLPSPMPSGVITSIVAVTSTDYPTNATVGPVTTNIGIVTASSLPKPLPPTIVSIVTNVTTVTNASLPNPPPPLVVATNTVAATQIFPGSPQPSERSDPGPWTPPYPGTYVGTVERFYQSTKPRGWYQHYDAIQSYVYKTFTYNIAYSQLYKYQAYEYSYSVPRAYTYYTPTTTNTTVITSTYDMVFGDGDYQVYQLTGKIYVRGNARVHVTGSIDISGQGGITIAPKNASLKLYMSGQSAKIAGNGIMNESGSAFKFAYYGMQQNTSLYIAGNGGFIGTIYAPYADFKLGGGGNDVQDFIGASVTASIFMNGHFSFHYDEDLARRGPEALYVITSWNEIGPAETAILRNPDWVFVDEELSY